MDDAVRAAMVKWPTVPACYGWLALDQRGDWRLAGDTVRHAGLIAFLGRNYEHDTEGNWYCQNGPQRVFVELACTPWVLRLVSPTRLETHTGLAPTAIHRGFIDDSGRLLLEFQIADERQIGLVSDHDLPALLASAIDSRNEAAADSDLLALMHGAPRPLTLRWQSLLLPLEPIAAASLPGRYQFNPEPKAPP